MIRSCDLDANAWLLSDFYVWNNNVFLNLCWALKIMGVILIMHNYSVLDGLYVYIYAKVYNVGNGITVYDFVKSTWYNYL